MAAASGWFWMRLKTALNSSRKSNSKPGRSFAYQLFAAAMSALATGLTTSRRLIRYQIIQIVLLPRIVRSPDSRGDPRAAASIRLPPHPKGAAVLPRPSHRGLSSQVETARRLEANESATTFLGSSLVIRLLQAHHHCTPCGEKTEPSTLTGDFGFYIAFHCLTGDRPLFNANPQSPASLVPRSWDAPRPDHSFRAGRP
jgi:hypothetical protein